MSDWTVSDDLSSNLSKQTNKLIEARFLKIKGFELYQFKFARNVGSEYVGLECLYTGAHIRPRVDYWINNVGMISLHH